METISANPSSYHASHAPAEEEMEGQRWAVLFGVELGGVDIADQLRSYYNT